MNCTKCGVPLTPDSRFCQNCGHSVTDEHNTAAGKWHEFRHTLSSGTETILAVLGCAIGKQSMATGQSEGGYAILSDKRLYIRGRIYRKRGGTFFPRNEENILDIHDVTGTGYATQNFSWLKVVSIVCLAVFILLMMILTNLDEKRASSRSADETSTAMVIGVIAIYATAIAAIVSWIYYKKCHAVIFQISYTGGPIGVNTAYIPKEELDFFQSCIRQQKDALDAASQQADPCDTQPQADPVAQLRQYKELLDDGIITQEEFENRKKALLDKII